MLYVTTRDSQTTYTALQTLTDDRGRDGGCFLPRVKPELTWEERRALSEGSFGEAVAWVLNRFFPARLTGADVEAVLGDNLPGRTALPHRVTAVKFGCTGEDFGQTVRRMTARILGGTLPEQATDWGKMALRIGLLFGIYAQQSRAGLWKEDTPPDLAVDGDGLSWPTAVWLAGRMGLPVGKIICGCRETDGAWELLSHGTVRTAALKNPEAMERFLCCLFGWSEAQRFRKVWDRRGTYSLGEVRTKALAAGFFVDTVSEEREQTIIPNVRRTSSCTLDLGAARALCALQNYRATAGSGRVAFVLQGGA